MTEKRWPSKGERYYVPDIRGRLVIGNGRSPIERAVDYTPGVLAGDKSMEPWHGSGPGRWQHQDWLLPPFGRVWLERDDVQGPGQKNAVVLAAAGSMDLCFRQYIGDLRIHSWAWLSSRKEVGAAGVLAFLEERFERHFGSMRERIEADLLAMLRFLLERRQKGPELEVDVKFVTADDHEFLAQMLETSVDRMTPVVLDDLRSDIESLEEEDRAETEEHLLAITKTTSLDDAFATMELAMSLLSPAQRMTAGGEEMSRALELAINARSQGGMKGYANRRVDEIDKAKRRIKRAYKLFSTLGLEGVLQDFNDGLTVYVKCGSGIELRATLMAGGHTGIVSQSKAMRHWTTPFRLSVHDSDGEELGRLCAYSEETPILDLLLSVLLRAESGSELELLMEANWYGVQDAKRAAKVMADAYGAVPQTLLARAIDVSSSKGVDGGDDDALSFEHEDFDLRQWISRPGVVRHLSGSLWEPGENDGLLAHVREENILQSEEALGAKAFDAERLRPLQGEIDRAIENWLGKSLARWCAIRNEMEDAYAGVGLPMTPIGWCAGVAFAFSGCVRGKAKSQAVEDVGRGLVELSR